MWRHFPTVVGARTPLSNELMEGPAPARTEAPVATLEPVPVPDLTGIVSTDARRIARAAHLGVTVEERPSDERLWGRIVEQDPAPGTLALPGDIVNLLVGARPRVAVPDIRGRDEDEAVSMLSAAGLGAARRATRRSDRVPEGHVVRTRPRAGALVPAGSRVSYVVAAVSRDGGPGARKRGRRNERPARLADGSFLLPEKGLERSGR